ncbi:MAG: bifunctional protein-serine/threonine kinase/phosphatase, partial [Kiritimatiellaceae bacterium]|nr:bifunctional protein-serine/threonine kinase/phosphatase [Kiritimatiellaceae bacterium]
MFHLDRTIDIEYASASASGRKAVNDDSLAVHVPTDEDQSTWKGIVAVLADGVSTADAGGQAAKMCVRRVVNDYYASPEIWSTQKTVSTIFTALNRRLYQLGTGYRQAEKGFVCTVSTLVLKSHHAYLFHVGDTRIYRLRAGVLQLLTTDHTAMENGNKAYLSRAIGFEDHVTVDCHETALENGDLFLLTTDGVHDHVSAARMQELANAPDKTLQTVCDQFLQEALAMNSPDNVSCIAIRIKKLPKISSGELSRHLKELPFAPLMSERASLDGYRIVREIYASARSQVYLVEDLESGKHYAMKTPSPNYNDNPHYIERFIMESWIGARIDSPHVVKVVSNCRPRSCLYYLTEYVDGGTLTEWMAQHPSASLQEVRPLIEQIVIGVRTK